MAKQLCANCGQETADGRDVEFYGEERLELRVKMCPRCFQALANYLDEFEEDFPTEESRYSSSFA